MKIGAGEFSTPANPLSMNCCPQASRVQAPMLLKNACTRRRRQMTGSDGNRCPRQKQSALRNSAAMLTRAAISVTGGISATATFVNR